MTKPLRTRSIGTKVTVEEYARLEARARDGQMSISEWSRQALLAAAGLGRCSAGEQAILAEVIALRTIVANLIYTFTTEGKVTADQMRAFIQRADCTKSKRAMELLLPAGQSARSETETKGRIPDEAH